MQGRIFISAVTAELGSARQLVANVLTGLGDEPVGQDIFGTEPGEPWKLHYYTITEPRWKCQI